MLAEMNTPQIESIITRLKDSDEKNKRLSRMAIIIFSLFVPLYAILFFRTLPEGPESIYHLAGGFYVVAFSLLALYFAYFYRIYNRVNYAEPVINVLKAAVKRLQLWNPALILPLISVVLIDASTVLLTRPHLPESWSTLKAVFVIEVFFVGLMLVSGLIGYAKWKHEQYPILNAAKAALQELENL
jgi:glucan phosphoethanolaminetransferase (alkaline phosphatase superfamily)